MPFHQLSDAQSYALIAYDADGQERKDDPDGTMSDRITALLAGGGYTDVLISSHGWKGDMPAAKDQYDRWFGALMSSTQDLAAAIKRDPSFKPLLIGLHWPSLPFGDEEFGAGAFFGANAEQGDIVERYTERLGDSDAIRAALVVIAEAAKTQAGALELPTEVAAAYQTLDAELGLGSGEINAPPDADRDAFDPDAAFLSAQMAPFGGFSFGGILAPLRQLSFWTMKKRARVLGEGAFHTLLTRLMAATPADKVPPRFHLMGHSFGCIVVTAAICGAPGQHALPRTVNSLMLIQGALSHWSYASAIPLLEGQPGYFHALLGERRVGGPIVVTRSVHDTAVGRIYPLAARMANAVDLPGVNYPRFGAIGAYGAQGLADNVLGAEQTLGPVNQTYALGGAKLHNFDASPYIKNGTGISGAHSDIAGPEVAHLWWETMRAGGTSGA